MGSIWKDETGGCVHMRESTLRQDMSTGSFWYINRSNESTARLWKSVTPNGNFIDLVCVNA